MGFLTVYTISVAYGDVTLEDILVYLNTLDGSRGSFNEHGSTPNEIKWYSHDHDLEIFSRKHPDCVFLLEGYSAEDGDHWRKYYEDGEVAFMRQELVWPNYFE